jgi:4-hydroxy-3-polyprenylbenzoate decarboxylase
MYKSLADYVKFLESKNELIRIKEFTDPILEISEITDRVSKQPGGGKALLFENTGTNFPVLTNMMGSSSRIAYALGIESFNEIDDYINNLLKEVMQERGSLLDKLRLLPKLKEAAGWMPKKFKGHAPCQESVLFTPDLSRLPILKCWPGDGGRFITLPLVHTKDPENGTRNLGMYRMQVFTDKTTGMHWHRHKTGAKHFSKLSGGQLPVAIALGGDPVYTYAATAPLPEGIDEYLLAGFLRNSPVLLTDCLTQPLQVPADCDFVIEGYVDKNEPLVIEGPFGDHTGFYSLEDLYPTLHITCISHKKEAIYPATIVGIPPQEDKYIAIATERIFLTPLKFTMVPEICDLHLPEEGIGHNIAIVKIEKSYPGQAIKVAHALWGAGQMMFNKIMIITDQDIDIRDHKQVLEAMASDYTPKTDTHFSRGPLDVLDHTSPKCGYGGKVMFDATRKLPEESGVLRGQNGKKDRVISFTHSDSVLNGQINIIVDSHIPLDDYYSLLWLWGSNCDPIRDSKFAGDLLVMDSRTKVKGVDGFTREWPGFALSSAETIDSVNLKWDKLGIGPFIESPSLKFLKINVK